MSGAPENRMPAWLAAFPSAQVRDLDPRRHALIEASAGTGKTFAIEHLVLRLLVENVHWKPEEILLLSFTERTVADLRGRIRALFRRQLREDAAGKPPIPGWSDAERGRIHDLWLHADDLSVHTLHGFCQGALLRDPIAHDALLRAEVADDRAVADTALEGLLRGAWARDPARLDRLRAALAIGAGDNWRDRLISLALGWHPWREDRLEPARDTGEVDRLEQEADAAAGEFFDAVAAVEESAFPSAAFRASFKPGKTGQDALRRHAYNKVLTQAEAWRMDPPAPGRGLEDVLAFFKSAFTKSSRVVKAEGGWRTELPAEVATGAASSAWQALADACAALRSLSERLPEARRIRNLALTAEAAMELRAAFDAAKVQAGKISYDDMPRNLALALRRNPALAARIARRYKACIVDEFQDTDPLQWEILHALCLREENRTSDDAEVPPALAHRSSAITHHSPSLPPPDSRLPALPLFLVGDPKQAIYAFRGGDLPTYLAARATFRGLAAGGRAQGFGLEANFRSRPALIAGLNAVFARPEWFGEPEELDDDPAWHLSADSGQVHFTPAKAGRAEGAEGAEGSEGATAPCIFLRDLAGKPDTGAHTGAPEGEAPAKKQDVQRELRRWISARIVTMLENGTSPKDIAVLVRKNAEGIAMERALRRRGIPCRIRRRGGAFHGRHADALRLLLEWIDDASDPDAQARILLLPFARSGDGRGDDFPRGRPTRCPPLVTRWAQLAREGRWPEFFASVRLEGGFQDRLEQDSPSEAEQFARLAQRLGEAGSAPGTTARALRERFDAWRRGGDEDGAEATAGESADDSVSILTLHMSKGLEYRVVFLAAAGDVRQPEWYALRDPGTAGFRLVLDKADPLAKAEHERQTREEDLRLFYVAFTRAADALHVPLLPESTGRRRYGPLGGFAGDALRAAAGDPSAARFFARDEDPVHDRRLHVPNDAAEAASGRDPYHAGQADAEAGQAATRDAFARRRVLTSYSRLAHRAGSGDIGVRADDAEAATSAMIPAAVEPLLEDDGTRAQRQEPVSENAGEVAEDGGSFVDPLRPATQGITAKELPPGAGAGTALHALLEHTPFGSVLETGGPEAWLDLPGQRARVEEALRRESVDPAHAPAAARAVWNALRAPIPDPADPAGDGEGATFRLADLAPEDLRHEVEFLLPFGSGRGADAGLPEGVAWKRAGNEVFLWGFIDLVFRREGRYYLLDWKSNLLPAYDRDSVERSMAQHRYDLQWKLYSVALDRWLAARLPGYEPEKHFGGVCYLYLRGASEQGPFSGFTARPTPEQLRAAFPDELAALLRKPAEETP